MADEVAKRYVGYEMNHHDDGTVGWMYLDADGELLIGLDHVLAGWNDPRSVLEKSIRELWDYSPAPYQVADYDLAGQEFGMQLRSSVGGVLSGIPVTDWIHPELTANPARFMTRNDPDAIYLCPWDAMTDEAEEVLELSHGTPFPAEYYQNFSTFRMTRGAILALAVDDAQMIVDTIRGKVPDEGRTVTDFFEYDTYPLGAQLALLDMAFQIGAGGIVNYAAFRNAVTKKDWKLAAQSLPRIAETERTRWRTDLLLKAADAAPKPATVPAPKTDVRARPPVK